jgi:hypothetical protein
MNHNEHPNDSVLTQQLRDSLAELATPGRPPLAAITTRGRTHQRRRLAGFAGITAATAAAAAVVLGLGLSGVLGSATADRTGTIRTTAFTLVKHANGTVTLTINLFTVLEPSTLQNDLQRDGIPAIVTTGSFCSSAPAPAGFTQVVSTAGPKGSRTMTINPAAMPAGTELSFGYFHTAPMAGTPAGEATAIALIDTNSHNCTSTVVTAAAPPPGAAAMIVNTPR